MSEKEFHSGFIAIIGRPNVGKSTLINALVGEKIAIVSDKPQTTRNRIMGVVGGEGWQTVFLDTPGVHTPRTKLGETMMKSVRDAMDGIDELLIVLDANLITEKDREILENEKKRGVKKIIALNKIDLLKKDKLLSVIASLGQYGADEIVPMSAKTGDGLEELKTVIRSYLPVGPKYFPDDMLTDQPERLICAELIREKALSHLRDEVPHGIGVEIMGIEKYERADGSTMTEINADVYCERDAHKAIIIGKGGAMLRTIGEESRIEIERLLDSRVNLKLWIKVRPNWRNSISDLRTLGYGEK
jgi:GTP-binding protein Era